MNEKAVLQAIHHPSLVNLEGVFQDEQFVYFVLEYVVGGELYMYSSEVGKLGDDTARFYTCQIVEALSYMVSARLATALPAIVPRAADWHCIAQCPPCLLLLISSRSGILPIDCCDRSMGVV